MNIRYLGHSSFLLTSARGTRIVTDPYGGIGYPFPVVSADIVTVSHSHFDHNHTSAVLAHPVVYDRPGRYELGGVQIEGFRRFHDDVQGKKRGENIIFRFLIDGLAVCHMGDIGELCSPEVIRGLAPVDVLLLPVGGNYTVDGQGAKAYVDALHPQIVIPMHFKTDRLNIDIGPVEGFTSLFPREAVKPMGASLDLPAKDDLFTVYIPQRNK